MPTIDSLIDPFFNWKQAPGKRFADSSVTKYRPLLEEFAAWADKRDVAVITTADLEFDYLPLWAQTFEERNGREPAQNTVRLKHNCLSSFLDYCWRRGIAPLNPMLAIPRPSYETTIDGWLTPGEDELMARVRKTPLEEIVYGLGRLAGLRCAEITGLRTCDLALAQDLLLVRGTKSPDAVRGVVVFPELGEMIERWQNFQKTRGLVETETLVTSAGGRRLSEAYAWRCVKRVAARAGVRLHGLDERGKPIAVDSAGENVSAVSPHTLRRTYGAELLNRGVRIEVVSAQLGHASVKITEKAYAKLRTETQRQELLRLGTGFAFLVRESSRGLDGRFQRRAA